MSATTWVEASPSADVLVIADEDGHVTWWDTTKGAVLRRVAHEGLVRNVRFSPTGDRLVVAEASGRLTLYDAQGEKKFTVESKHEPLRATAFHKTKNLLVTAGEIGKAIVWEVGADDVREAYRIEAPASPGAHACAFAGDDIVVLGFTDGFFEARTEEGKRTASYGEVFANRIAAIAAHPRFSVVVFGGGAGKMVAVKTTDWVVTHVWKSDPPKPIAVNQLAMNADGSKFLAASSDRSVRLVTWSDQFVRELGRPFYLDSPKPEWDASMIVSSACWDRSGKRAYSAHFDGTVGVWQLEPFPRKIATLRGEMLEMEGRLE